MNDADYEEEYTHIPVAHKISHRNSGIFGMRRLGQSIVETWEQQTLSKDKTYDNKNDNEQNELKNEEVSFQNNFLEKLKINEEKDIDLNLIYKEIKNLDNKLNLLLLKFN